jgi:hypothetical protein
MMEHIVIAGSGRSVRVPYDVPSSLSEAVRFVPKVLAGIVLSPNATLALQRISIIHVAAFVVQVDMVESIARAVRDNGSADACYSLVLPDRSAIRAFTLPCFVDVSHFVLWKNRRFDDIVRGRNKFYAQLHARIAEAVSGEKPLQTVDTVHEVGLIASILKASLNDIDLLYLGGDFDIQSVHGDFFETFTMRMCPRIIVVTNDGETSMLAIREEQIERNWLGRSRTVHATYRTSAGDVLAYRCDTHARLLLRNDGDGSFFVIGIVTFKYAAQRIQRAWRRYVAVKRAVIFIQKRARPWLDTPVTRDKRLGIRMRIALKDMMSEGLVAPAPV